MTNQLATLDQTKADIMRQMGVDPNANTGDFLPTLKINYNEEDEQGNEIKKGLFTITDQEEAVYAETATFRPMAMMFQYVDFDNDANKVMNKSVIENNLVAEFPDEKGTLKCGKPTSKYLRENPDEVERYKSIKAHRLVYGVATIDGKTATGKKVKQENVPVVLNLSGANFMGFDEEFVSKMPKGALLPNFELNLTRTKETKGSLRYFIIHYATDFKQIPVDNTVIDTVVVFHEIVERNNKGVMEKHVAALRDDASDDGVYNTLDGDLVDQYNESSRTLDDEIPF